MKNPFINLVKSLFIILGTSLILISCSRSDNKKNEYDQTVTDKSSNAVSANQQDQQPKFNGDSTRDFIRKANLSFKVKDVKKSTFDIESIINANNGYVTTSNLESTINTRNSVRISKDSILDVINYTVYSDLIMRIPNGELDKTLSEIAALIDYLDYRRINAEDVTAQFQNAKLAAKRYTEHTERLEKVIDKKGKKLDQLVEAENNLLEKQEELDQSKITKNELTHDVDYSTIAIHIYQKETTKKEMQAYSEITETYKPNFGVRLMSSLTDGVIVFEEIFLFLIKLWPIALLVIGFIFIFKRIRKLKWFS